MSKRESALKSAWIKELKRQLPAFYVLSYATAGAPDRSIIGGGRQTNWEAKHCTPDFTSHENQALFCTRLALAGHCRYILWWETSEGTGKRTMIVHPRRILNHELVPEAWTQGFDHDWLVQRVKEAHRGL